MRNFKKIGFKYGFTLAEVLIVLIIIGVIAAITIPSVMQNTQKQEFVSALQKSYSTLSQATNYIIAEHGSPNCTSGGWACSSTSIYEMYKKYLSYIKDCNSNKECWYKNEFKTLDGSTNPENSNWRNDNTNYKKFILADGILVMVDGSVSTQCKGTSATAKFTKNWCAKFIIDINGIKSPNIWGRDVFHFMIKEDGLVPYGCDAENIEDVCSKNNVGYGCACRVLNEGTMNY